MLFIVSFIVGVLIVSLITNVILYRGNKQAAGYITQQGEYVRSLQHLIDNQRAIMFGVRQLIPPTRKLVKWHQAKNAGKTPPMSPSKVEMVVLALRCAHVQEMLDEYDAAGGQQRIEATGRPLTHRTPGEDEGRAVEDDGVFGAPKATG